MQIGWASNGAAPPVMPDSCQCGITARLCCTTSLAYPANFNEAFPAWDFKNDCKSEILIKKWRKSRKTITEKAPDNAVALAPAPQSRLGKECQVSRSSLIWCIP